MEKVQVWINIREPIINLAEYKIQICRSIRIRVVMGNSTDAIWSHCRNVNKTWPVTKLMRMKNTIMRR